MSSIVLVCVSLPMLLISTQRSQCRGVSKSRMALPFASRCTRGVSPCELHSAVAQIRPYCGSGPLPSRCQCQRTHRARTPRRVWVQSFDRRHKMRIGLLQRPYRRALLDSPRVPISVFMRDVLFCDSLESTLATTLPAMSQQPPDRRSATRSP